jgi:Helix-turn-helix domain
MPGRTGTGAFPSVARLVRYTGLSERTVRTCLDRLDAAGIIRPCDPEIVTARIKRADRRPKGWDLDLSLIRDDLTEASLAALERRFPGLAARVAVAACPDADGLQSPHPAETVDNWPDGVQPACTPHPERGATSALAGCNRRSHGVQQLHPNRP